MINRLRHQGYPKISQRRIYEGAAGGAGAVHFTCDGVAEHTPSSRPWTNAEIAAKRALAGFVMRDVGATTNYHANYVYPYWAPTLGLLGTLGAHIFYRWTGPSGRQTASGDAGRATRPSSADILMGADPRTPGSSAAGIDGRHGRDGPRPAGRHRRARQDRRPEGMVEILPPMTGDPPPPCAAAACPRP